VEADEALFRREAARLLAALTRTFGPDNVALAEDVVQETIARAFEAWSYDGVPDHYAALLTTAAKNRALDVFRRERTARKFAPELRRSIEEGEATLLPAVEQCFLPEALKDDALRMMFSCCDPGLDEEVQVALVLKMLCSLEVDEIAGAFLATPAAIEKRLSRGKKVLAASSRLFDLTAADFAPRVGAVQRALYLLFSEGYHGASADAVVRVDLCHEAMRLVELLVEHPSSATPPPLSLAALMCLDAARLPGRLDDAGNVKTLFEQDRTRWDATLIAQCTGVEMRSSMRR
jgi:RNA polymerase sigma-70 factor (ECF subfamily)